MTIKELIERLSAFPQDLEVIMNTEDCRPTRWPVGSVEIGSYPNCVNNVYDGTEKVVVDLLEESNYAQD